MLQPATADNSALTPVVHDSRDKLKRKLSVIMDDGDSDSDGDSSECEDSEAEETPNPDTSAARRRVQVQRVRKALRIAPHMHDFVAL